MVVVVAASLTKGIIEDKHISNSLTCLLLTKTFAVVVVWFFRSTQSSF